MKFSLNATISLVTTALMIAPSTVFAEVDGSLTCHSGSKIPGNFHGNNPAGSLAGGGFDVLVDGQPMSLSGTNSLSPGSHTLTIKQSGGSFVGLYIWADDAAALSKGNDNSVKGGTSWQAGGRSVKCNGSSALTHTGMSSKTQSSGILTMPASGTVKVEFQPMTSWTGGSTFYYSSLTFQTTGGPNPNPNPNPPISPPVPAPVTPPTQNPPSYNGSEDSEDSEYNDNGGDKKAKGGKDKNKTGKKGKKDKRGLRANAI